MTHQQIEMPPLEIGDIVFIAVPARLFKKVSAASLCWSNHVGIVCGKTGGDYRIAESRIPFSGTTTLSRFISRSENCRFAVRRLPYNLTASQKAVICAEAAARMHKLYHTGFNLDSGRQFCSKFVREIYLSALDTDIGKIERFGDLLNQNPEADLAFWKIWFFGKIPWDRRTVTPAALWSCPKLVTVFDSGIPSVDHAHADKSSACELAL